jgi:light-regulated signal transduction histidine kinase (bacteriophytochrome)
MPGLSGQETCLRIKASPVWRDIPLLMLTALEERDALLEGINAGADDYITKSNRFEVLMARLKAQLRRCQFEDENRSFRERLLRKEMEALEVQAIRELSEARAGHITDLERKNGELRRAKEEADALAKELESFSYSVSHDLRAPLRSIDGFSQILLERHRSELSDEGGRLLGLVRTATKKMGELIDDMLGLARVTQRGISLEPLDLSTMALATIAELRRLDPDRTVEIGIQPGVMAFGDKGLVRILFENLLGNAWKFTSKTPSPRITFGTELAGDGRTAFAVRDNGAGFDMAYADKLFQVFQRLHLVQDFPGTGVGLATVARVVKRHGGKVWCEGKEKSGACFYFTLQADANER